MRSCVMLFSDRSSGTYTIQPVISAFRKQELTSLRPQEVINFLNLYWQLVVHL